MKTWTERIGIVAAAGVLSTALNAPPGETQQLSSRAGAVPSGGIIFQTGDCWPGWTEYTPARGRYVVGLVSGGTEAGTAGTALGDRESRATGAHSHGSGTLGVSYTPPTVHYTRPTASYSRPTVTYRRPTASYTRPTVNYTRPSVGYSRPTVNYTRPTASYTRPTVNHQHVHEYEGFGTAVSVDGGNDAAGRQFGSRAHFNTKGQSAGPRVSGGGVTLSGGGVTLSGGGVDLTGGGVRITGGGVRLRGGGATLTGGGVTLSGGGVRLSGGGGGLSGATGSAGRGVAAPYIQLRACRKL